MTWVDDVRVTIRAGWGVGDRFSLHDLYAHERRFAGRHPATSQVRANIRRALQTLRDVGIVEFLGQGNYRRLR